MRPFLFLCRTIRVIRAIRIILIALFSVYLFSLFPSPAQAATCTVTVQPNQSIQAKIDQANSGDTICVKGGNYTKQQISIGQDNIILRAYDSNPVWIDGEHKPTDHVPKSLNYTPLMRVLGNDVTIDGINVRNSHGRGIYVDGNRNTLKNLTSDHAVTMAISVFGDQNTFDQVRAYRGAHNLANNGSDAKGGTWNILGSNVHITNCEIAYSYNDPLVYNGSSRNSFVQGCKIYDNANSGVLMGGAIDAVFDSNVIFRTEEAEGGAFVKDGIHIDQESHNLEPSKNLTITNNLIVNFENGINLAIGWDIDPNGNRIPIPWAGYKDIKIANNTIINSKKVGVNFNDRTDGNNHSPSWLINNIVITEGDMIKATSEKAVSQFTFANNLYSNTHWPEYVNTKHAIITNTPLLINREQRLRSEKDMDVANYILSTNSPGIDAGTDEYDKEFKVSQDYFKNARPIGKQIDVGFHEYTGSTSLTWDLNHDNVVNILDFSHLLFGFPSSFSFPNLSTFISSL